MYATTTARGLQFEQPRAQLFKSLLSAGVRFAVMAMLFVEPAFATGNSAAAQARITAVATGWQNIVIGIGVAILVIAWSVIGYAVAFNGKTMKDMQNPAIGTSVAGLAPVLVGWMFS
jgi:hypothetical protein